jgi:hypothetical protein
MLYYGDQDEVSRLTHLLTRTRQENKSLKEELRKLKNQDEWLAAEQSAEILNCKGHQVKDFGDRYGLAYTVFGSRRFHKRSEIEKLRDQLRQARV